MSKVHSEWIKFSDNSKPLIPDKYLVCRKDGKIHWETWNGSGWAYNHNTIKWFAVIYPPE